jgi:hypothetical protein
MIRFIRHNLALWLAPHLAQPPSDLETVRRLQARIRGLESAVHAYEAERQGAKAVLARQLDQAKEARHAYEAEHDRLRGAIQTALGVQCGDGIDLPEAYRRRAIVLRAALQGEQPPGVDLRALVQDLARADEIQPETSHAELWARLAAIGRRCRLALRDLAATPGQPSPYSDPAVPGEHGGGLVTGRQG